MSIEQLTGQGMVRSPGPSAVWRDRGVCDQECGKMSDRERLVLTAIIELYIATGEPVASQAVARFFENREGLSSATIRNVMASLGDAGMLEQPHTSAGRVPTAAAFRYYVEQITHAGQAGGRQCEARCRRALPDLAERRTARPDRTELFGRVQQPRIPGTDVAGSGAPVQRPGGGPGHRDRFAGAGAHSFFAPRHGPRAGRAGDADGCRAGPGADSRSRDDRMWNWRPRPAT